MDSIATMIQDVSNCEISHSMRSERSGGDKLNVPWCGLKFYTISLHANSSLQLICENSNGDQARAVFFHPVMMAIMAIMATKILVHKKNLMKG